MKRKNLKISERKRKLKQPRQKNKEKSERR